MSITNYSNERLFHRLLNNKSSKNYWKYIGELRKRTEKSVFQKSSELIKSEKAKEKIIGINILAQFGFPRLHLKQILKLYFNLLKTETDKNVISSVFYGIGHNNEHLNDKQIDIICYYKDHKSVNVRHSLVYAILGVEKIKSIETLIQLSEDKNSDIRNWATFGLGTQITTDNEIIQDALWKRIKDKDEDTKFEAIVGLAKRKIKDIRNVLKNEVENMSFINPLLIEAIEEFKDQELLFLLNQQIENKKLT
ncbi:hypothetical protein ASE21_20385 [Flavobacterium sp. Root901]|nr:hypothetical protein ASE21_20385 [Flavobacterium sp. Root901]